MKIVMLARLFSPHIGGVERHVEEIAKMAVQDGNDVTIVTSQYQPSLSYKSRLLRNNTGVGVNIRRIPLVYIHTQPTLFHKLQERARIWLWMVTNLELFLTADIIHIHDVFWWYWPIRILLPWKRAYMTFHGFEAGTLPTQNARKSRSIAEKLTHGNICVGAWIEKWYGTKPTFVSYGGAACKTKKSFVTDKSKIKAVFIGRLEIDTGLPVYIRALKKVKNISLDIFGDGPLANEITRLTKGSTTIRSLGQSQDTCQTYSQYDIAFVSSYLSMIESLQCGVPVVSIATDTLKADYLASFPVSGYISISQNEDELRKVLESLNLTVLRRKEQKAFSWAENQTWENVYTIYRKLWNQHDKS